MSLFRLPTLALVRLPALLASPAWAMILKRGSGVEIGDGEAFYQASQ